MVFRKVVPTIGIGLLLFLIGGPDTLFAQCARWQKIQTPFQGQINGVAMSPDGRHIVLSGGFALHSSDGGATWEQITSSPDIMTFGDNTHLFGVASSQGCNLPNGSAAVYRSADYGGTWGQSPVPVPMCFNDVFFLDSLHGWAVGSYNDSIVITRDGGKTFVTRPLGFGYKQPSGLARYLAAGVSFRDTLNGYVAGWLVGTDSAILRTSDGGNTWKVLPMGIQASVSGFKVYFTDTLHGWFFGFFGNGRHILTSSDGGQSWIESIPPPHEFLMQIKAIDSLQCWIIGDAPFPYGPRIWKSGDGGQTWRTEYDGPGGSLMDFEMADATHGVAVGDYGTVLIYSPVVTLGDLNGDGAFTITDVVLELNWVFLELPFPCLHEAGDVNCDSIYSPSDVILLLRRVFLQTSLPCNL